MSNEYKRYEYRGPVYYYGNKIANSSNVYTMAKTFKQARNNIIYKIADGDYTTRYDIVDHLIREVDETPELKVIDNREVKKCDICGYELNAVGDCPICDYDEYDLIDLEG